MSVTTDRTLTRGASLLGELINESDNNKKDETFLPTFIVYYILSFLKRTELNKCTAVSKLWKTVASDSCFGWMPVWVTAMGEKRLNYASDNSFKFCMTAATKYSKPVDLVSLKLYDSGKYEPFLSYKLVTKTETKRLYYTEMHSIKITIADAIAACEANPKLWRYEVLKANIPENISLPHHDSHISYFNLLEINVREMEKMIEKKETIPMAPLVTHRVLKENLSYVTDLENSTKSDTAYIPMKAVTTQKQPRGLIKTLKLYKYQLDAVAWLKSVEEDVDVGFEVLGLMPWREAKSTSLFSYAGLPVAKEDYNTLKERVFPRGGILADEMGLGIFENYNILAHPGDPSQLAANVKNEEEKEEEEEEEKIKPVIDTTKAELSDLFLTNATLIVCPEHLVKQWHGEIEKYTRPILSVIEITNVNHIKACRYSDIVNADVVLVSKKLLNNENYEKIGAKTKVKLYNVNREHQCNQYLWKIKSSSSPLDEKVVVLENFLWRRIVVDEAQEIANEVLPLGPWNAKYFWYVSGTPFPNTYALKSIIDFLKFPTITFPAQRAAYIDIFKNNLYWRNTKESVKNEYTIPPIVEDLVLLNFSPLEKIIYDFFEWEQQYYSVDMISYFPINRTFTTNSSLETIREKLLNFIKGRIEDMQEIIKTAKKDIERTSGVIKQKDKEAEEFEKQLTTIDDPGQKANVQHTIENLKWSSQSNSESLQHYKARVKNSTEAIVKYNQTIKLVTDAPKVYTGVSKNSEVVFPEQEEEPNENKEDTAKEKETDEKEEEISEQEAALPWSAIVDMSVPQLKAALDARKVTYAKYARKADLQKILKEAVKNNVKPVEAEKVETTKGKGKRKTPSTTAKPAKKKKVANDETDADNAQKSTIEDKLNEKEILNWLVEKDGTKLANLTLYLKRVWTDTPSAKIIIFSQHQKLLDKISAILVERNVDHATFFGNIQNRVKQLNSFKTTSEIRVLLLDLKSVASGTNIIEATHIILMEPYKGPTASTKAFEEQAIGRAYRQGQTVQVTVTRFIVRDTAEYKTYVQCYGGAVESSSTEGSQSGHAKLQRSSSLVNNLVSATPSEAIKLLENDNLI